MSYDIWNNAIGQSWFQSLNHGKSIVLVADSTFLESIANENDIPLDRQTASQHFVDSVRQAGRWRRKFLPAGKLPSTSAYMAMAILAASHMDSEVRRGMTSYWTPFNELYGGDEGNRQIPRELKSVWLGIWLDVKEWANEKNDGKYGFLRFPDHASHVVRDPHKNIRFPKSQSLLKLEDRKRITVWFDKLGLQPGESLSRRWFAKQIRESLTTEREFSVHARRVFKDDLRFDAAVDQLLSFFAAWDGKVWNLDSGRSTNRVRSRLVFAFRFNRELVVGSQRRRESTWVTESKHHNYPVSRVADASSARSANPLAAVWCDQSRLFLQSKMIAANDRFLVFMKPPSYLGSDHAREKYANQFLDDLRRASSCVEPFASGSFVQRISGCVEVSALQHGWCMFSGTANADLHESQLTSKTGGLFAPDILTAC